MSEVRQWADGSLITQAEAEAEGLRWVDVCLYTEPVPMPGEALEAWRAALNRTQPVRYADTFEWSTDGQTWRSLLTDDVTEQPVKRSWRDRVRIWIADTCDEIVEDVVRRLVDWIDPDIRTRR